MFLSAGSPWFVARQGIFDPEELRELADRYPLIVGRHEPEIFLLCTEADGVCLVEALHEIGSAAAQSLESPILKRLDRSGRTTAIHGASALTYVVPFIVAGLCALWFAARWHSFNATDTAGDLRFSFLALFGGVFSLGDRFFSAQGVLDLVGESQRKRLSAKLPASWLRDYPWRQEGFKVSALPETIRHFATAMISTAIVAPFGWVAFGNPLAWAFDLFVATLALFPIYAWWQWLVVLAQALRFGNSFLRYDTFPFFAGSALSAVKGTAELSIHSVFDPDFELRAREVRDHGRRKPLGRLSGDNLHRKLRALEASPYSGSIANNEVARRRNPDAILHRC
jgi:hypothetical protein